MCTQFQDREFVELGYVAKVAQSGKYFLRHRGHRAKSSFDIAHLSVLRRRKKGVAQSRKELLVHHL